MDRLGTEMSLAAVERDSDSLFVLRELSPQTETEFASASHTFQVGESPFQFVTISHHSGREYRPIGGRGQRYFTHNTAFRNRKEVDFGFTLPRCFAV